MIALLPSALRLKHVLLIVLLLGLWSPLKLAWEHGISREQDRLRYHGLTITPNLRDQLGQGLTLGVLSGMGNVVADFLWLEVTVAWENEEWFKIGSYINLCTTLQPRSVTFWDIGGWQLAWNASVAAMHDPSQPNPLRRIKASRYWIAQGLAVYQRGIENNPDSWKLWAHTALLYQQRLEDFHQAAIYYQRASELPDAPTFYERFPAIMYHKAGEERASYEAWRALWLRLTPAERNEPMHQFAPWQMALIRQQEQELKIPLEKRIFPK